MPVFKTETYSITTDNRISPIAFIVHNTGLWGLNEFPEYFLLSSNTSERSNSGNFSIGVDDIIIYSNSTTIVFKITSKSGYSNNLSIAPIDLNSLSLDMFNI